MREGKHGARSFRQAIAIGLSKARRAGIRLPPPKKGAAKKATRTSAKKALAAGKRGAKKRPSAKRARATALSRTNARSAASSSPLPCDCPRHHRAGNTPRTSPV
ncbi:MAG: DUF6496 domain-containing protein [Gemmatimonadota bacterium]